ncbi:hypothetical protein EXIGLDRAFT_842805 [Exidia glandulosa HHB12029]|uniref:F-box domain-containing protein n=1 Tax=Exidia glandulosa HHB12029 TaxID=1314781 RepID=A0A165D1K6_EXIGL|nr:hypothetical protein EXIGLDRAFT_842805 [Exidia glandulosa HHB12029]
MCAKITDLPTELLASIMLRTLDQTNWLRPQLACSHVCRHWRAVALKAPGLWSRLVYTNSGKGKPEVINFVLERTGPAVPLRMELSLSIVSFFGYPPEMEFEMLDATVPPAIAAQLQREISENSREVVLPVLQRAILELGRTEWLDLVITGNGWYEEDLQHFTIGHELHTLRHIELEFSHDGPARPNLHCPEARVALFKTTLPYFLSTTSQPHFPQLEELTLSAMSIAARDMRDIFNLTPQLRQLKLDNITIRPHHELTALLPPRHAPPRIWFERVDGESTLAIVQLDSFMSAGIVDVAVRNPVRSWNYFSTLYDVLALERLGRVKCVSVDGLCITLWDDAGQRRCFDVPTHVEALWKMLAERLHVFEMAEEWEIQSEDPKWCSAFAAGNGGFIGAERAIFYVAPRAGFPAAQCFWPSLRQVRVFNGKVLDRSLHALMNGLQKTAPHLALVIIDRGQDPLQMQSWLRVTFPVLQNVVVQTT